MSDTLLMHFIKGEHSMSYQDYINMALDDNGELKVILKGEISQENNQKIGVVSIVFITKDVNNAKAMLDKLNKTKNKDDYYMLYSCPLDTELTALPHYPSLEISKEDLI